MVHRIGKTAKDLPFSLFFDKLGHPDGRNGRVHTGVFMRRLVFILLPFLLSCGENLRGQYNDPPRRLHALKMAENELTVEELNTLITETNAALAQAHQEQLKPKPYVCLKEAEWKIRPATARQLEKTDEVYQWVALGPSRSESEAYGGELKAEFDHVFTDVRQTLERAQALYSRLLEADARLRREPDRKILHAITFSLGLAVVLSVRPLLSAFERTAQPPANCSWKPFHDHIQWMKNLVGQVDRECLTLELKAMQRLGFQKSELFTYRLMYDIAMKTGAAREKCLKLDDVDRQFRAAAHIWCGYMHMEAGEADLAAEHLEEARNTATGAAAAYVEEQLEFLRRKNPPLRMKKVN